MKRAVALNIPIDGTLPPPPIGHSPNGVGPNSRELFRQFLSELISREGHRVFVLTVSYGGERTRQFSVRRERVTEVRRLLANYQKLKKAIEGICELNHELLRPDAAASKSRRKQHD